MLTGQNPPDKPERRENEMAVTKTPIVSTIRLSLITGLDDQGGPILRTTSLSNVKSAAVDQDLFE